MAARPPDMSDWYSRQGLQVKGGGITLQSGGAIKGGQTDFNTGTGFFLGYSGGKYKFSIGSSTNNLTWDGSTLAITGNISGNSNLYIGGTARIEGETIVNSTRAALYVNSLLNSTGYGLIAYADRSGYAAVWGVATGSANYGVYGYSNNTTNGIGGYFSGPLWSVYSNGKTYSGDSLTIASGQLIIQTTTGTAPISVSSTTMCTNLNADMLDGQHASSFLGVSAQAADSAALAGYSSGNWLRQTGVTAGTITPNYYITVVSGGITVRVPCAYP